MSEERNRPISGGKAVVECLKAYNIKYVFGLIGSATMELFDALYDEKSINFVDVRDERTGTHMADAYARASGNHGVIINGVHPTANKFGITVDGDYLPFSWDKEVYISKFASLPKMS